MNRLKTNTLSIFALAFLSATSLSAAGVVEYDSTVNGSYEAALVELAKTSSTTTETYEDGYTLTQSDTGTIIKYLVDENGNLTAVKFAVYTNDETYNVVAQAITSGTSDKSISMNFVGLTGTSGVTINNKDTSGDVDITGDFIGNYAVYSGGGTNGVLTNSGTINSIAGDFVSNYSRCNANTNAANGGFIFNTGASAVINSITGDFIGNYAQVNGTTGDARGGAIWNYNGATITAIEGSFISNFAQTTGSNASSYAIGGAVLNTANSTIGFLALNTDTEFTGNFTVDGTNATNSVYTSNAIANTGTANFNAYNGYTITVNDGINNTQADGSVSTSVKGTININGAVYAATDITETTNLYANSGSASKVIFNNSVTGQDINVYAGTLELGSYAGELSFSTTTTIALSYTTLASVANLVNSTISVNDGATLQIAASGVSFDSSSSLTLSDGATLILDASSSMIFDSASSLAISVSEGDFSITFNVGAASSITLGDDVYSDIYAFLNDESNLAELFGADSSDDVSIDSADSTMSSLEEDYILTLSGTLSSGVYNVNISTAAVPEPSTYAMIFGVIALGFAYYRRRK